MVTNTPRDKAVINVMERVIPTAVETSMEEGTWLAAKWHRIFHQARMQQWCGRTFNFLPVARLFGVDVDIGEAFEVGGEVGE